MTSSLLSPCWSGGFGKANQFLRSFGTVQLDEEVRGVLWHRLPHHFFRILSHTRHPIPGTARPTKRISLSPIEVLPTAPFPSLASANPPRWNTDSLSSHSVDQARTFDSDSPNFGSSAPHSDTATPEHQIDCDPDIVHW